MYMESSYFFRNFMDFCQEGIWAFVIPGMSE
jgi:hypothetical protein